MTRRQPIGLCRRTPRLDLAMRVFDHHDRTIDQQPDNQNQREKHHSIGGKTDRVENQNAQQERPRYRHTNQARRSYTKHRNQHDQHQQHRVDDAVLQVVNSVANLRRFILGKRNVDALGPGLGLPRDQIANRGIDRGDRSADPF